MLLPIYRCACVTNDAQIRHYLNSSVSVDTRSATGVVKGWLDSPGHCENIMDPRFAEMGIAYSPGQVSRRGLYLGTVAGGAEGVSRRSFGPVQLVRSRRSNRKELPSWPRVYQSSERYVPAAAAGLVDW